MDKPSKELLAAFDAIETSEQLNKPWPKAATADRDAALDAMRGRIELYEDAGAKRATIILSTEADAVSVTHWKGYRTMKTNCVVKLTKPGLMLEAALAMEALAEIAEAWEREAKEQS